MKQTVLAWHELYKATIRHDAAYGTLVNLTNLRNSHNGTNLGNSSIDAVLIGTAHLNLTNAILFIDSDSSTGILLHLLNDLSARANHSTNELLRNLKGYDAGYVWFKLSTWLSNSIGDAFKDVLTASLSLHKSFFQDFERQTVALDIHLSGCQTVLSTSGLEVHITQMVLVAEDIAQYSIFIFAGILNQTHGNT